PVAQVLEEEVGAAVVGDVDVLVPIVVEVAEAHPHAASGRRRADAGGGAGVLEGAVPAVAEEAVRDRPVGGRSAVVDDVVRGAGRTAGLGVVLAAVVRDVEVEPAIAVVIAEGGPPAHGRIADSRLAGDVAEGTAVVPV